MEKDTDEITYKTEVIDKSQDGASWTGKLSKTESGKEEVISRLSGQNQGGINVS